MKTRFYTLFVVLALAGLLFSACSAAPTPVEEPPADEAALAALVNATGVVIPAQWSTLSVLNSGLVEEVLVEEGQVVEPGQVLVRVQGQVSLEAAVSAAELEASTAQQALDEINESAVAAAAQAQLRLANAEKALDKAIDRRGRMC